jgi:hypothetical protein
MGSRPSMTGGSVSSDFFRLNSKIRAGKKREV